MIFLILLFSFIAPFVFSLPLEGLVTTTQLTRLRTSDRAIIETQLSNPAPRLMPQNAELRQLVNRAITSVRPNMMVEILYLYRKPARYHTSAESWDNTQRTGIFNQMLAISTLQGVQYYSSSRDQMRVFYEYSRVVDGPSSRNPRPDPVYSQVPANLTLYTRQRDSTFGENVYRYEYITTRDTIFFTQENLTSLAYGIIPVIGRGNLRSVMAFYDCGDSLLIYAISLTNAFSVPGVSERISNSLSNRAEAILNWFVSRLNNHIFIQ
jgi:hypothetical protein